MTSDLFVGARVVYEGNSVDAPFFNGWLGRTGVITKIINNSGIMYPSVSVIWDNLGVSNSGRSCNFRLLATIDVGDMEDDL